MKLPSQRNLFFIYNKYKQQFYIITGIALFLSIFSMACVQNEKPVGQQLFVGDNIAIASTKYGKVQGFIKSGIYTYRGIPYGANTAGKNRFMPPKEPEAWKDTLPALWWGNSAPQISNNRYGNPTVSFMEHWNYDDVSEDCLKLNVWTPGIEDGKKRPVLVWFHGGGFRFGNAIEQDGYKGENLSRKGDIVFCSVNHRLGAIGFSDLSAVGGEKYANSGNVGALDMVAALKWVNENIANFGGDPNNVTIMGQSGGGAKVCVLAAMPSAKGLFHKMVPLSGSSVNAADKGYTAKLGEYILKAANLSADQIDSLQTMPWEDYIELANKAVKLMDEEIGAPISHRSGFSPVADGVNVVKGTFFSEKDGLSSEIPMLISTTFHEWSISRFWPDAESMTKEDVIELIKEPAGFRGGPVSKPEEAYEAYAKVIPGAKPVEIASLIRSSRKRAVTTANAKSVQNAPVYMAWFGWEPDLFNGRVRSFHCLDICFWFYNTDDMMTHTGGGEEPRRLAEKMSDALLQFMRTGNPNANGLPVWPEYTPEKGEVMILNNTCEVKNDPDREARAFLD